VQLASGSSASLSFGFDPPANDGSSYSATFAFTSPNVPSGFSITVTGAAQSAAGVGCTELFLSEYVEGGSNNKAVEIFNPTNGAIVLDGVYALEFYFNGGTSPTTTINLTGSVPALGTFVVADNDSVQAVLDATQQQSTAGFFNGNDAVVLARNGQPIDRVGRVGEDAIWTGGGLSTQNQTLRRKASVSIGDPAVSDAFDPSVEWEGFAQDTFDGLGAHSADGCGVSTPAIFVEAGTLDFGGVFVGVQSEPLFYTVSASGLVDDLVIDAPVLAIPFEEEPFQVSLSEGSGFGSQLVLSPVGGTVGPTTIWVRFQPAGAIAYSEEITHSSLDAAPQAKLVTGEGFSAVDDWTLQAY
jgi:hypothetical protein